MYRRRTVATLVALLFVWAGTASADPTLSGAYDIVDVAPYGETQANVTVRLRVQNVSGGYVANVAINLTDEAGVAAFGAFVESVSLDQLDGATLEVTVTVDRDIAMQWMDSTPIRFDAAYIDANGMPQRRLVDAPRMPIGEGM